MAILLFERHDSRKLHQSVNALDETLHWIGGGTQDENAIYAATIIVSPLIWDSMPRSEITCTPVGNGVWDITVKYAFSAETEDNESPEEPDPNDATNLGPEFSFDITAETAHITQSLATTSSVAKAGFVAPNYQQAIAVSKDRIEGCDVYTGHLELGVTVQVFPVQLPYIRTLLAAVGTTNNAKWYQFDTGCLLYLGATGTCKPGEVWTLHHKFAMSPNLTNIQISPGLVVAAKAGWEFLWCAYVDQVVAGLMLQVPVAAYTEQVYRSSNFTTLGLGGP